MNRKEPKLNLFRLFFGLFHETKKYKKDKKKILQPNTYSYRVDWTPVDRHVQVHHKSLVDRHAHVQQRFL